jgi:hypothetical protein
MPRCGHWHAAAEPTRVICVEHTSKHGRHYSALPCQPQWHVRGRVSALYGQAMEWQLRLAPAKHVQAR